MLIARPFQAQIGSPIDIYNTRDQVHPDTFRVRRAYNPYQQSNQQLNSLHLLFSMMQMFGQLMNAWSGFGGQHNHHHHHYNRYPDKARPDDRHHYPFPSGVARSNWG